MGVPYELFPGHPTIEITRKETSGTMRGRILWSDIQAFAQQIFPDPFLTGYVYGASLPGFPWAVAKSLKIKPFDPNVAPFLSANWVAWYDYAEFEVGYGIADDDLSKNTPGGNGATFTSYKVHAGGEFVSYPSNTLAWETPAVTANLVDPTTWNMLGRSVLYGDIDTTQTQIVVAGVSLSQLAGQTLIIDDDPDITEYCRVVRVDLTMPTGLGGPDDVVRGNMMFTVERGGDSFAGPFAGTGNFHPKGTDVKIVSPNATVAAQTHPAQTINCTVATPLIEHTFEWNYVIQPPWLAIRSLMGKVNAYTFLGAPEETMLFLGAEASIEMTSQGLQAWKLSYKLSEKNQNAMDPTDPQGWNHFLRSNGDAAGQFQRLGKRPVMTAGLPPTLALQGAMDSATTTFTQKLPKPFPQVGQYIVKTDGTFNEEFIACTVMGDQMGLLRGVLGTRSFAHVGGGVEKIIQVPGGVYDLGDFRFLAPVQ